MTGRHDRISPAAAARADERNGDIWLTPMAGAGRVLSDGSDREVGAGTDECSARSAILGREPRVRDSDVERPATNSAPEQQGQLSNERHDAHLHRPPT